MSAVTLTPTPGVVCVVEAIPDCNFCQDGTPGPYDFATRMGPWANGCEAHWKEHRAAPDLGVGKGQLWITPVQELRAKIEGQPGVTEDTCPGCYLGDDGPPTHDLGYGCAYGKGAQV